MTFLRRAVSCFPAASVQLMNLLDPQGPVAVETSTILVDSVFIMLTIVVPTIVAILGFAWWFRALALAFNLLIVFLVVGGSVWIMHHLNQNMPAMDQIMRMQ